MRDPQLSEDGPWTNEYCKYYYDYVLTSNGNWLWKWRWELKSFDAQGERRSFYSEPWGSALTEKRARRAARRRIFKILEVNRINALEELEKTKIQERIVQRASGLAERGRATSKPAAPLDSYPGNSYLIPPETTISMSSVIM